MEAQEVWAAWEVWEVWEASKFGRGKSIGFFKQVCAHLHRLRFTLWHLNPFFSDLCFTYHT